MAFELDRIDHIVLNCLDPERTIAWYQKVLGMKVESYDGNRTALVFGKQKFNVRRTQTVDWKTSDVMRLVHLISASSLNLRQTWCSAISVAAVSSEFPGRWNDPARSAELSQSTATTRMAT